MESRHVIEGRGQVGGGKVPRSGYQCFITTWRANPRLSSENFLDHVVNKGLFVSLRHALWDQYDDGVAFPVRGYRASTTAAPSHFNAGARLIHRWR